jgi:hypothetical protein
MNQNQNVTEVTGEIMDEQLAEIYGTGQPEMDESDLEKTAAAELLVKLAEEQGVDLNDFSDEEVGEMLDDLYGPGVEHTAEADPEADPEAEETQETQEKYAEADYLGRIMAHSMVQELDSIEKEAGIGESAKAAGGAVGKWFKGRPAAYRQAGADIKKAVTGDKKRVGFNIAPEKRWAAARSAAKGIAPEAGTAAGLTGAGLVAAKLKGKDKEASGLEAAAEQRAYEMAEEAGYIDKEASDLEMAVERRALEICESQGIPVEWNE